MRAFPGIQNFCFSELPKSRAATWDVEIYTGQSVGCWKYQLNSSKPKLSKGMCFQCFILIVGMFTRASFKCLLGQVWEIPPENHRAGTVTHTVGWPMDLMSYGGVGFERTATNCFVPCQTLQTLQPPAPRFVLPARWLHLPYGAQSSSHRPWMLCAMMVMMGPFDFDGKMSAARYGGWSWLLEPICAALTAKKFKACPYATCCLKAATSLHSAFAPAGNLSKMILPAVQVHLHFKQHGFIFRLHFVERGFSGVLRSPYQEFQRFKMHPRIKALLEAGHWCRCGHSYRFWEFLIPQKLVLKDSTSWRRVELPFNSTSGVSGWYLHLLWRPLPQWGRLASGAKVDLPWWNADRLAFWADQVMLQAHDVDAHLDPSPQKFQVFL